MNRQWAINLRDGRVVLCTRETLTNIDYYAISERVAVAIETGALDRKEIIAKVKGKLLTNQEQWDELLTKKTTQNVRHSSITPEDTEQSETKIDKADVDAEFDMNIPGEGKDASVKSDKGGDDSGNKGKTDAPKTDAPKKDAPKKDSAPAADGDLDLSGM